MSFDTNHLIYALIGVAGFIVGHKGLLQSLLGIFSNKPSSTGHPLLDAIIAILSNANIQNAESKVESIKALIKKE